MAICLDSLEELDRLARLERHDRLLPVRTAALEPTDPLDLAAHDLRTHVQDLHVEELLHRVADLQLVRVAIDLEQDLLRVVHALAGRVDGAAGLTEAVALLGEDGALDDV